MDNLILISRSRNYQVLGWALLTFAFSISLITLYKGEFVDEADSLVVGSLILQRYVLYRDVFSHHFPFPYYWTAMVIALLGKSIFFARLSILVFQFVAFALGMQLGEYYCVTGATAIIWSIIRSFYRGHMVLYNSFSSAALCFILLVILAILQQRTLASWRHWLTIGIFSAISILSDPLSIYAIIIALVFLLLRKPTGCIKVVAVISGILALYAGYLFVTGSYKAFWSNAILFNSQVYANYTYTSPLRIKELYTMVTKGLGITDKTWLNFNPRKPIADGYAEFDHWFFTGFLYRFSVIAVSLLLALRKQVSSAIFMYLFAASTLTSGTWGFHGQAFVMVSLVAISTLIIPEGWPGAGSKALAIARFILSAVILVIVTWLCIRLMTNIRYNFHTYGEAQFARYKQGLARIQELTCNQSDVLLAYYPGGTYYYWFTGMKPVSKYVFMWPWIADIGLDDVIYELSQEQVLAIAVVEEFLVWDKYDTKVYLYPLIEFLEANYYKVAKGTYLSPALYLRCSDRKQANNILQLLLLRFAN